MIFKLFWTFFGLIFNMSMQNIYRVTQKKRNPILIILNTRGPFFLGHPVYIFLYKIRPKPSCFGITSLISDNNQGGPYQKPHNKITQSGVWAFNTVKRRIAVAKEKKNRLMELARLISRKTKTL